MMQMEKLSYFLTLVLVLLASPISKAAPNTQILPSPVPVIEKKTQQNSSPELELAKETLQPTLTNDSFQPELRQKLRPPSLNSDSSSQIGLGFAQGILNKAKKNEGTSVVQLQRTWTHSENTAQEFGLSLMGNRLMGLNGGFKWYPLSFSDGKPFYKLGAWGIYDPTDTLGNFIDYERYFLTASVGFEKLLPQQKNWRMELGGANGYLGFFFFGQLIYRFSD